MLFKSESIGRDVCKIYAIERVLTSKRLRLSAKKGLSKFVMGRFMGLTKNVIWAVGAKKNVVREVFAWQLSDDMRRGMNPSSDLSESHIKKGPPKSIKGVILGGRLTSDS